jgi:hypothetical protein
LLWRSVPAIGLGARLSRPLQRIRDLRQRGRDDTPPEPQPGHEAGGHRRFAQRRTVFPVKLIEAPAELPLPPVDLLVDARGAGAFPLPERIRYADEGQSSHQPSRDTCHGAQGCMAHATEDLTVVRGASKAKVARL